MKYKLNLKVLRPGDIILVGYNDPDSREIQKRTNSKYSHAMLLWYDSIIHAGDLVITENPSRQLFDEDEPVCVLRLDEESWFDIRINCIISYARSLVGTLYDKDALKAMEDEQPVTPHPNRQMCARFVAECYAKGFVSLSDNPTTCTPEYILQADDLVQVQDCIIPATDWDIKYAESKNVTSVQYSTLYFLIQRLRVCFPQQDIMSLQQLEAFIDQNPDKGELVLEQMRHTQYLNLWKIEAEYCPYLYNKELFVQQWGDHSIEQAYSVINGSERIIAEKSVDIDFYEQQIYKHGKTSYYKEMITLRKNIIDKAIERCIVAKLVLAENGIATISIPSCV